MTILFTEIPQYYTSQSHVGVNSVLLAVSIIFIVKFPGKFKTVTVSADLLLLIDIKKDLKRQLLLTAKKLNNLSRYINVIKIKYFILKILIFSVLLKNECRKVILCG